MPNDSPWAARPRTTASSHAEPRHSRLWPHSVSKCCPVNDLRVFADLLFPSSPAEGEVVQAGNAEHCVVNAVAFEAAVTEDLPGLHPGEGVLDAGPDLAVRGVVLLFPCPEFALAGFGTVKRSAAPSRAVTPAGRARRATAGPTGVTLTLPLRLRDVAVTSLACCFRSRRVHRGRSVKPPRASSVPSR